MTAYLQQHLRDPELTPERMAAAGFISLRSLYVLFAARGETPVGYLRQRRLAGAPRELSRTGTRVTVADVAHSWGFGDQATFSRAFRAAYGRTPDEVRRSVSLVDRAAPARPAAGRGTARRGAGWPG